MENLTLLAEYDLMLYMKPQDAREAISAIVNTVPTEYRPELFGLLKETYPQGLGSIAMETAQLEPVPTVLTWEQQLEKLSPERRIAAGATREVLVKKYESYGYGADDFSLIPATRANKDGQVEETFAVALSATQAVDLSNRSKIYDKKRSWDSIDPTKANKQFMVTVNGKEFDERKGVTLEAMRELTALNPEINEWIWETGRPDLTVEHSAPIVRADAGYAYRVRVSRDYDIDDIVLRPIVVLE